MRRQQPCQSGKRLGIVGRELHCGHQSLDRRRAVKGEQPSDLRANRRRPGADTRAPPRSHARSDERDAVHGPGVIEGSHPRAHDTGHGAVKDDLLAVDLPRKDHAVLVVAGDAWAAGFLFGHLRGWPLPACGALASLLGAETVMHMGPIIPETHWDVLMPRAITS